jgi:DNA-directed RNA polymerase specialized sigma24 family protein
LLRGGGQVEKKSKAQIFLERVEKIDTIIENKLIEQRQWKDLALSITANMGGEKVMSSSKSSSPMADAIVKCISMETEIAEAVDKLITAKKEVVRTIEKLYSPTEYKILHMRYIQHLSLTDIADKMNREYTWVTTTHGRALKNVQKMLESK